MEGGSANMEARVIWRPGRLESSGGEFNNPQVGNSPSIVTAEGRTVFRENSPFSAGHPVNPAARVSFSCQKFFLGLHSPAAPRRKPKPISVPHRATFCIYCLEKPKTLQIRFAATSRRQQGDRLTRLAHPRPCRRYFFVFPSPQPAFRLSVRRQSMPLGRNSIR